MAATITTGRLRASDYLPLAICAAPQDDPDPNHRPIPCHRGRLAGPASTANALSQGRYPAVIWRMYEADDRGIPDEAGQPRTRVYANLMDGPTQALYRFFEIECRADAKLADESTGNAHGAAAENLADEILDYLRGHGSLTHILSQEDERDDTAQKESDYISHVLVIGLHADVEAELGWQAVRDYRDKYEADFPVQYGALKDGLSDRVRLELQRVDMGRLGL